MLSARHTPGDAKGVKPDKEIAPVQGNKVLPR